MEKTVRDYLQNLIKPLPDNRLYISMNTVVPLEGEDIGNSRSHIVYRRV